MQHPFQCGCTYFPAPRSLPPFSKCVVPASVSCPPLRSVPLSHSAIFLQCVWSVPVVSAFAQGFIAVPCFRCSVPQYSATFLMQCLCSMSFHFGAGVSLLRRYTLVAVTLPCRNCNVTVLDSRLAQEWCIENGLGSALYLLRRIAVPWLSSCLNRLAPPLSFFVPCVC